MDSILKEDSMNVFDAGKIVQFIHATDNEDKGARPLLGRKRNAERFSHTAKEAQRCLATEATSVACYSIFSAFGNLINAYRTRRSDVSIMVCMCVLASKRFPDKV